MPPLTLETFLARVYTDPAAREAFLRDPAGEATRAGLPAAVAEAMGGVDAPGVAATAEGLARKGAGGRAVSVVGGESG